MSIHIVKRQFAQILRVVADKLDPPPRGRIIILPTSPGITVTGNGDDWLSGYWTTG
jgi:hypothetical protein